MAVALLQKNTCMILYQARLSLTGCNRNHLTGEDNVTSTTSDSPVFTIDNVPDKASVELPPIQLRRVVPIL